MYPMPAVVSHKVRNPLFEIMSSADEKNVKLPSFGLIMIIIFSLDFPLIVSSIDYDYFVIELKDLA